MAVLVGANVTELNCLLHIGAPITIAINDLPNGSICKLTLADKDKNVLISSGNLTANAANTVLWRLEALDTEALITARFINVFIGPELAFAGNVTPLTLWEPSASPNLDIKYVAGPFPTITWNGGVVTIGGVQSPDLMGPGTPANTAILASNAAVVSANNAYNSETNAGLSASAASLNAANANTAKNDTITLKNDAAQSAINAATSETNSATSASNAATSASNAATSASNAAATLANVIPKSLLTTKGDLIVGTGAGAVSRVAVGAPGTTLVPDEASPAGVKWSFPPMCKWGPGDPRTPATTSGQITGSEPNGYMYRSTDGGGVGGYLWTKRAGVWVCDAGDTGAIAITPDARWLNEGVSALAISRVGRIITVHFRLAPAPATVDTPKAGYQILCPLPAGWRPEPEDAYRALGPAGVVGVTGVGAAGYLSEPSLFAWGLSPGSWGSSEKLTGRVSFRGPSAWPTTLAL